MHIAVEKSFADLLELLLSHGGDLEARNNEGDTPIALAIDNKNDVVIEKIVDHVKRKKQNTRLEALRAEEALLTPSKRGRATHAANLPPASPYYVDVKRQSRTIVIHEVIEISDESTSEEEEEDSTQYFTPVERSSVNLFELTKENLDQFTRSNRVKTRQRRSLVSRWCDNIRRSDRPLTMLDNLKRVAHLFTGYEDDTTSTIQEEEEEEEESSEDVYQEVTANIVIIPQVEDKERRKSHSLRESEIPQEFIDLCAAEEEEQKADVNNGQPHSGGDNIPEIIITSPDQSLMDHSLPKEIRQQLTTSDYSRSPPEYQLYSDEEELEEQEKIRQAVEDAELPVIEISESNTAGDDSDRGEGAGGGGGPVNESTFDESNFIKSPKPNDDDSIEQLVEEYEHRDVECGMKFLELKLVANNRYSSASVNRVINMVGRDSLSGDSGKPTSGRGSPNSTMSSIISTAISVPLDYDTDALRDELKSFGCNPGPITTTTKRLYLRRLIRYKKDPRRIPENSFDAAVQCKFK